MHLQLEKRTFKGPSGEIAQPKISPGRTVQKRLEMRSELE